MTSGGTVEIGWVDTFDETDLEAVAAMITDLLRDAIPGERPYPSGELAAELVHHRSYEQVRLALARRTPGPGTVTGTGEVVGAAMLRLDGSGSNRHIAWLEHLLVDRGHRREGIGGSLLELVVGTARDDGRTVLSHAAPVGHPAATAFAERAGATRSLVEHQNRLAVADLDRDMLERWVERSRELADGCSLVAFDGPCPEELLDRFAHLVVVMDTAPRGDIWEDTAVDASVTRENGLSFARRGGESWTVCARHDATGELVGYTELGFLPYRPWLAFQGDTGVQPTHRNRGIGRWLKATNALRLLDEHPEIEVVETWNAEVNAPMLSINRAMGFRSAAAWQEWELRIA